jgi:hypothetical protein
MGVRCTCRRLWPKNNMILRGETKLTLTARSKISAIDCGTFVFPDSVSIVSIGATVQRRSTICAQESTQVTLLGDLRVLETTLSGCRSHQQLPERDPAHGRPQR